MSKLEELEHRVSHIEERNSHAELNKAWETSWTRKMFVAIFTYLAIAGYMNFVLKIEPWINAIVPTVGFLLSTLTLPFFKQIWTKYVYKK